MIVGIDLGTTHSLIAVWENHGPRLIPNIHGNTLTPSVVSLDPSGNILVGISALNEHSIAHFKRFMGSHKIFHLGRHVFRPEELSALVIKSLIRDAEAYLGTSVTEAVVTVPAYFNDAQRKATRLAGELAGLKVERLLNEPTAAALAYGIHQRDSDSQFLVFDLGGGTFDVSIVELFSGIIEVRSSAGDNRLGGEDFTDMLDAHLASEVWNRYQINPQTLPKELQFAWRQAVRNTMHELSARQETQFRLELHEKTVEIEMTRARFNHIVQPLMVRLRRPLEQALRDARIHPGQLDSVLLVGGATRIPLVQTHVAEMFGKYPLSILSPDETVALGAGVQAALKQRSVEVSDVVITDVCPFSLGTEVIREDKGTELRFLPIIERNTTIPASRVERLYTVHDNQTCVSVGVYQGESFHVKDNVKIGEIEVNLSPRPAGEEGIDVRYSYDINGILEVEVTVVGSGRQKKLVINNQNHQLSESQIAASLEKLKGLKIHPRDQLENRKTVLQLESLFEFCRGIEREEVTGMLAHFNHALDSQDPQTIVEAKTVSEEFIAMMRGVLS